MVSLNESPICIAPNDGSTICTGRICTRLTKLLHLDVTMEDVPLTNCFAQEKLLRSELIGPITYIRLHHLHGDSSFRSLQHPESELIPYQPPSVEKALEFRKIYIPHRVRARNQPTGYRLARLGEKMNALGETAEVYNFCSTGPKQLDEFGIDIPDLACYPSIDMTATRDSGNTCLAPWDSTWSTFDITAKKAEVITVTSIDESHQTTKDYSVCIQNPPLDFINPDSYYKQYRKYGEIVFITVVLNNGKLVKQISEKRVIEHKLKIVNAKAKQSPLSSDGKGDVKNNHESELQWKRMLQPFGFFETSKSLERSLKKVEMKIQKLCDDDDYRPGPNRAYIIFNTEDAQRRCLRDCETGQFEEVFNKHWNPDSVLGNKVVSIQEAEEPSEIVWENLHRGILYRSLWNSLSLFIAALYLYLVFLLINHMNDSAPIVVQLGTVGLPITAVVVALVNLSLPFVVKLFVIYVEVHKSLTSEQRSMMLKLVLARMVNSAFLLYISTEWPTSFTETALGQVVTILIFDAFTPAIRLLLLHVYNFIEIRFIATRMNTQEEMNNYMKGNYWNLAERYTDMVKTVFVGMFYSAITPTGLIITVVAMTVTYYSDKYSLLRLWSRPPAYDASLAALSRKYLVICVWVHLVTTRVYFSNWPYIRQQGNEDVSNESSANRSNCGLFRCSFSSSRTGEDVPTDSQGRLVNAYELFGLLVFVIGAVFVFLYYSYAGIVRILRNNKNYSVGSIGNPSNIPYRSIAGISCYVPLTRPPELLDPLFAIDVGQLPVNAQRYLPLSISGLYSKDKLSMCTDIPRLKDDEKLPKMLFSIMTYYPVENEALEIDPVKDFVYDKGGYMDSKQPLHTPTKRFSSTFNVIMPLEPMLPAQIVEGEGSELPDGWERDFAPDGRPFYLNHKTHTTTWNHPCSIDQSTGPQRVARQSSGSSIESVASGLHYALSDLPNGWEVQFTDEGRPYYVNHILKTTQWEHPTLAEAADGEEEESDDEEYSEGKRQLSLQSALHDDHGSSGSAFDIDDYFNECYNNDEKKGDSLTSRDQIIDHEY